MSRSGRQRVGQLPLNWLSHPFLQFPDDIPSEDRSFFISRLIALLSKQFNIPQALVWRITDDLGLQARSEPYITRVFSNDNGL